MRELFQLAGKRALVIGGATGMGAAVAELSVELGAELVVLDIADITYPVAKSERVDLSEKHSVEQALNSLDGSFDVIYACAGVADGTPDIVLINFTSQRHIVERLIRQGSVNTGGSIIFISSVAGLPFTLNRAPVEEFLATSGWEDAASWIEQRPERDDYSFSKQAINGYVESKAFEFLKQGIRINAVMPGPTDTPLARANADSWLGFGQNFRKEAGLDPLAPQQVAAVMVFFASDASSGLNGTCLLVDYGHVSAGASGSIEEPAVKMMLGMPS